MKLGFGLFLVAVLAVASLDPVAAQTVDGPGLDSPHAEAPLSANPPLACREVIVLRDERMKNLEALLAAKHTAAPDEYCKMFKALMTVETIFIEALKANSAQCGVPEDIIKKADEGHGKGLQVMKWVCDLAANHSEWPQAGVPSGIPGAFPAYDPYFFRRH